MKKLLLILISAALIVCVCAPLTAYAQSANGTAASERDSVHFIAPSGITVVGDKLYVADGIEDGKTAIICFDAASDSPEPLFTFELNTAVSGLSNNGQNALFAYGKQSVVKIDVTSNGQLSEGEKFESFAEGVTVIDFVYGSKVQSNDKTMYAMTQNSILQYLNGQFQSFANLTNLTDTAGMLAINDGQNAYLYYLHGGRCDRYKLHSNGSDEQFAAKLNMTSGFTPTGTFALGNVVGLYGNTEIYEINESDLHADTVIKLSLTQKYGADCRILDVESKGDRLFVLNSKNQIDIFDKGDGGYDTQNYATIGSDTVNKSVPTKYTRFTLARPEGYPANIVYKTSDNNTSIDKIYTDVSEYGEYVILGYDGDEQSHYYYVMIGDKFGWVKKSDKWKEVNTQFGQSDTDTEAQFKFTSLNAVYVYDLPNENANQTQITQSASQMLTVKVLQKFTDGGKTWYFVKYDGDKTGFVTSDALGKFSVRPKNDDVKIIGDKKINSSLFAAVNMYATADLTQGEEVVNADGTPIKLYSGAIVKLIREENGKAYVAVYDSKGNADYGWLESSRLIGVHSVTTNVIVGLSLLAFAVALGTILAVVYVKRKKRIKANKD